MKKYLFTFACAASFVIASVGLAAIACFAQTNNSTPQPEKSSDPAIRWQFNTAG